MTPVCFLEALGKHSVLPGEKLTLRRVLTAAFSCLTEGVEKAEPDASSAVHGNEMRGCGYELQKGRHSDFVFPNESGQTWEQGPKEVVKSLSLEILKP